jgi:hypothetical protein
MKLIRAKILLIWSVSYVVFLIGVTGVNATLTTSSTYNYAGDGTITVNSTGAPWSHNDYYYTYTVLNNSDLDIYGFHAGAFKVNSITTPIIYAGGKQTFNVEDPRPPAIGCWEANVEGHGGSWGVGDDALFAVVPEPATICMLSLGGLAIVRRRK